MGLRMLNAQGVAMHYGIVYSINSLEISEFGNSKSCAHFSLNVKSV